MDTRTDKRIMDRAKNFQQLQDTQELSSIFTVRTADKRKKLETGMGEQLIAKIWLHIFRVCLLDAQTTVNTVSRHPSTLP